ncbi:MAG: PH domain-containing protein [Candidatus Anstonellales archaeon]
MVNFNFTGIPFKPSYKSIFSHIFVPLLFAVLFYSFILMLESLIGLFASINLSSIFAIPLVLIILIFASYYEIKRHYTVYKIDNNGIEIITGIINKREAKVPYRNIQNIFVEKHLVDRLLNIGTVYIETASATKEEKDRIELYGIEEPNLFSDKISEKITALSKEKIENKEYERIKAEIENIKKDLAAVKEAIEGFGQHVEMHENEVNYIKSEIEKLDSQIKIIVTRLDIITNEYYSQKNEKTDSKIAGETKIRKIRKKRKQNEDETDEK